MLIVIFAINIVSGPLNSFIFFAQVISLTAFNVHANFRVQTSSTLLAYVDSLKKLPVTVAFTLYDAWNLNVSPYAYIPFFCLTNHLTRFQALILVYIRAFYPLVLIALLCVGIKLHNWNFRPVVCCWKPFLKPFLRFKRIVNPKTSVIDVFATFILLSYSNVVFATMLFLVPQSLYNGEGQKLSISVMAFSPSTLFFHKGHLPLAIFSIFVLLTFIAVPPIVLLFYQTSFFKKCLRRFKINSQTLRTFVETFQVCYKDGTNGTRDCRYFAGLYFILRVVIIVFTTIYSNLVNESVLVCGFIALLFALVRPYKKHIYNVIDAVMFGLMATIFFFISWNLDYSLSHGHLSTPLLVTTKVMYWLPLLYLVLFTVCWVLDRKTSYIEKLRRYNPLHCFFQVQEEQQEANFDDTIPDRLLNPEGYVQL